VISSIILFLIGPEHVAGGFLSVPKIPCANWKSTVQNPRINLELLCKLWILPECMPRPDRLVQNFGNIIFRKWEIEILKMQGGRYGSHSLHFVFWGGYLAEQYGKA